jgi:hypothetical protein
MRWFATSPVSRYRNCRFWRGSRRHSLCDAIFRPSHANKNLLAGKGGGEMKAQA